MNAAAANEPAGLKSVNIVGHDCMRNIASKSFHGNLS